MSNEFSSSLSHGQERIWIVNQHDATRAAYNELTAIRLTGTLDAPALERAINSIVARHDVLRTRYVTRDGVPHPVVDNARPMALPVADLGHLSVAARESEARRLAVDEGRRPFDLETEIPIRARLVRLAQREHLLLITIHHIAFDGWSQEVLWRELADLCDAYRRGEDSPLPPLPWQYADFARWDRGRLPAEKEAAQLAYWKETLAGAPAAAVYACDYSRPAEQSFRGGRESLRLPAPLTERLKAIGRDEGATLYMVLLATFATLLNRYIGQSHLVIGTPYAERKRRELAPLIGFCVNTLALRLDLSGEPTFRELLARVRKTAIEAFDHADVPFDRVVESLQLERNAAIAPLVQVMFQLRRHPGPVALPELTLAECRFDLGTAKSELAFEVAETPDGLLCEAEFSTDLFERSTVERLLASYQMLLEGIVADAQQQITELPLLPADERRRMLALGELSEPCESNYTAADVVQLFCAQVDEHGDAVAVICEGRSLTYRELDGRSNQLARYLQSRGVRAGDRVAVYDERSIDLVVAILAIFKAGGVYVPLEADVPRPRLRALLDDVQPAVVLTRQPLLSNLAATDNAVCVDLEAAQIAAPDDSELATSLTADQLAYILFTSGSSGTPKGVMVSHRSLSSHCQRIRREYGLTRRDRVLQFAPVTFDPSLEQVFCSLLSGATLVMRGNEPWDGQRLSREVRELQLTFVNVTPVVFRQWTDALAATPGDDRFGPLRLVVVGGDVLSPAACEAWRRVAARSIRVLNAYGPTEATITSTLFDVARYDARRHGARMPIGRPAGNSCVYILDVNLEPVPYGAPGEIYLGGDAVAAGYWNRAELTAERFVADPFASAPHARLYKTGDLARWLPDGQVDFLGRADQEVKIRGCRIEPAEIEAALCRHPSVREAVVVPRNTGTEARLVAYVVAHTGRPIDPRELRGHLRGLLPGYMIPSAFVPLAALPMTRQGKVDAAALPPAMHDELSNERITPRTAAEQQLAVIWQRLFDNEDFGVTDNFFDAGGDSLSAVALVAEINRTFGVELPLATILQAATIEQLALLVDAPRPQSDSSLVLLQPSGAQPPFFCVHTVGGLVLRYRSLALLTGHDRPFYAIEAQGVDGRRLPQSTVEAMAARYVQEITAIEPRGPYYLGGYCSGGILAYEMAQQLRSAGRTVEHVVLIDSCHPRLWESVGGSLRGFRAIKRWVRVALHYAYQATRRRTPPRITDRLINEVLRRAFTHYQPQPYAGRLSMIRSTSHPYGQHPLLGWESLVAADTPVRFMSRDHEKILDAAHVRDTAAALRETLNNPTAGTLARAA